MSANEHRRICMVYSTSVYMCVCMCVSIRLSLSAYIMLLRPCNQWNTHFHVSSTHKRRPTMLWKILGTVPCSFLPLILGWTVLLQMNKAAVSDLSQPSLDSCWAPCHGCLPYILNSMGGHFVVFGPCDRLRLQHTSRGVVYITQSHLDNLYFFFHFGGRAKKPQKWEWVSGSFHAANLLFLWDAKPNLTEEVCAEKMCH